MSAKKKTVREEFRDRCFKRDGYRCRICGKQINLDAHHITNRKEMPNGGYVPENGITLCDGDKDWKTGCHYKAEKYHIQKFDNGASIEKFDEGFHPNDLYELIGSSYEKAVEASKKLK